MYKALRARISTHSKMACLSKQDPANPYTGFIIIYILYCAKDAILNNRSPCQAKDRLWTNKPHEMRKNPKLSGVKKR